MTKVVCTGIDDRDCGRVVAALDIDGSNVVLSYEVKSYLDVEWTPDVPSDSYGPAVYDLIRDKEYRQQVRTLIGDVDGLRRGAPLTLRDGSGKESVGLRCGRCGGRLTLNVDQVRRFLDKPGRRIRLSPTSTR